MVRKLTRGLRLWGAQRRAKNDSRNSKRVVRVCPGCRFEGAQLPPQSRPEETIVKYLRVKPDVFPLTFHFLFGKWDEKEALKKVGAPKGTELENPSGQARCWDMAGHQVIWIEGDAKDHVPLLVHEIIHAALHSGAYLGFHDAEASAEYFAYTGQYLAGEVLKKLAGYKGRI